MPFSLSSARAPTAWLGARADGAKKRRAPKGVTQTVAQSASRVFASGMWCERRRSRSAHGRVWRGAAW
eukprot:6690422-Prymnesium_polylepis.1